MMNNPAGFSRNGSALNNALEWWATQDSMGGFEAVARNLFSGWTPKRSCRAPHREDRHPSFSVYRNPAGKWKFKDHGGDGAQGSLFDFVMLAGMDTKTAARWLIENSGMPKMIPQSRGTTGRQKFQTRPLQRPQVSVASLPTIAPEVLSAWFEGVDYLQSNPDRARELAASRGWPVEFALHLAETMAVSMPLYYGERGVAFPVLLPENNMGAFGMRMVGYHARLNPKERGWRFVPHKTQNGQSIPALPFSIGAFDSARLLVITEGQWDALTFALAAGWLGEGCNWPEGVCILGMRGAGGVNTFLKYYRPFWPENVECLLLPDGDEAGLQWTEGNDPFDKKLQTLCSRVVVQRCVAHKDFNDLYRAGRISRNTIAELLDSHFAVKSRGGAA